MAVETQIVEYMIGGVKLREIREKHIIEKDGEYIELILTKTPRGILKYIDVILEERGIEKFNLHIIYSRISKRVERLEYPI